MRKSRSSQPSRATPQAPPLHVNRQLVADRAISLETDIVLLDGFDAAIIGTAEINGALCAVYDRDKMVACLMKEVGPSATFEEAEEHLSYNTERAISYITSGAPIIVSPLEFVTN